METRPVVKNMENIMSDEVYHLLTLIGVIVCVVLLLVPLVRTRR